MDVAPQRQWGAIGRKALGNRDRGQAMQLSDRFPAGVKRGLGTGSDGQVQRADTTIIGNCSARQSEIAVLRGAPKHELSAAR